MTHGHDTNTCMDAQASADYPPPPDWFDHNEPDYYEPPELSEPSNDAGYDPYEQPDEGDAREAQADGTGGPTSTFQTLQIRDGGDACPIKQDVFNHRIDFGGGTSPVGWLPEGEKVACPVEGHDGELKVIERGRQLRCTCDGVRNDYVLHRPFPPPPLLADETIELQPGQYLPPIEIPEGKDLGIRAAMGIGKTERMAEFRQKVRAVDPSRVFIAITSRVSLVDGLAERLTLPHYREDYKDENDRLSPIDGSVATCINSIRRISLNNPALDGAVVILDEIESTLQALVGGTMTDLEQQAVLRHFRVLLGRAALVILIDANLSKYSIDFIRSIRGKKPHIVNVRQLLPWKYRTTGDRTAWEAAVFASVRRGERVAIAMTSKRGTKTLAKRLQARFPDVRIALINQDTVDAMDGDQKKYDLRRIDTWVRDYDVLIYSPTIASGVSIDVKDHFDRIFGYLTPRTLTAQEDDQMLHRVRHPKQDQILVYLRGGQEFHTRDVKRIKRQIQRREAATVGGAAKLGFEPPDPNCRFRWDAEAQKVVVDAEGEAYLDHYCETVAYQRRNGVLGVQEGFHAYLNTLDLEHPWLADALAPVTDAKRDELNREKREATDAVKAARRKELLDAINIDIDTAKETHKHGTTDPAKRLQVEKAFVQEFYGDVDDEILTHDDDGRGRAKYRALAHLLFFQEDREAHGKALRGMDWGAHRRGVSAAGLRHIFEKTQVRDTVLGWYGVDGTDTVLDRSTALTAARQAWRHRKWLRQWGFTVRQNINEQPLRLLGDVLRSMGLKLKRVQRRVDGVRMTVTRVDLEVLDRARKLAAAELDRLRTSAGVTQHPSIEKKEKLCDTETGAAANGDHAPSRASA